MEYVNYLAKKYSFSVALAIVKSKPSETSAADYILQAQNQFKNPSSAPDMEMDDMSINSSDFDDNDYIEDTCAIQSPCCTQSIQNEILTEKIDQVKTCRLNTNETNVASENMSLVYAEESQPLLKGYDKKIIQVKHPHRDIDTSQFLHQDIIQKGQSQIKTPNVSHENHCTGKSQELLGLGDDDIFCEMSDTCNLALLGTSSEVESQSILKNVHISQCLASNINYHKHSPYVLPKKIIDHDTHSTGYENADEDSDATQMTNIEFNDEYIANIEMDLSLDTSRNEDKQHNTVDSDAFLDTNIDVKKTCLNAQTANPMTQNLQPKLNSHTKRSTNTSESENVVLNANSFRQIVDSHVDDTASQNIESGLKSHSSLNSNELRKKCNMHAYKNNDNFVKSKSDGQLETNMVNTVTQNINTQNETIIEMLSQAIIGINEDMNRDIEPSSEGRLEIECSSVPFKVVIELNKVKQTLTAMSGYNMDTQLSGYKSDSQMNFTQNLPTVSVFPDQAYILGLQDPAVNQSANCLLVYLSSCSVNCLQQPVTADIANALSKFIDMMYERDIILPFMDEILPCIDHILERILSGKGCGKDETSRNESFITQYQTYGASDGTPTSSRLLPNQPPGVRSPTWSVRAPNFSTSTLSAV